MSGTNSGVTTTISLRGGTQTLGVIIKEEVVEGEQETKATQLRTYQQDRYRLCSRQTPY